MNQTPGSGPGAMAQLDAYAEQLRVKVPPASENLLEGYVKYVPWVAMVVGALSALTLLSVLGISMFALSYLSTFGAYRSGASLIEELLFALLLTVANVIGGYLMLQRKINGWWLVAAGLVIYLLQDLVTGSLIGLLITLAVAYVHIQVKPRYS